MLYCVISFVLGAVFALIARRLLYRRFKPQEYEVKRFSRILNDTGVYEMDFYLPDKGVAKGYTKKAPPEGVEPKNLIVTIRQFHKERGLFRVFWRIKT